MLDNLGDVRVAQGKLTDALGYPISKAWRSANSWPIKTNPTQAGSEISPSVTTMLAMFWWMGHT
jgi:hypothetical protein